MRARAAASLPARLDFAPEEGRAEGWGRLVELSPAGAVLLTQTLLARRDRVRLTFAVGEEKFRELRAEVEFCSADAEGYSEAELRFLDPLERKRLARSLLEAMTRQPGIEP